MYKVNPNDAARPGQTVLGGQPSLGVAPIAVPDNLPPVAPGQTVTPQKGQIFEWGWNQTIVAPGAQNTTSFPTVAYFNPPVPMKVISWRIGGSFLQVSGVYKTTMRFGGQFIRSTAGNQPIFSAPLNIGSLGTLDGPTYYFNGDVYNTDCTFYPGNLIMQPGEIWWVNLVCLEVAALNDAMAFYLNIIVQAI